MSFLHSNLYTRYRHLSSQLGAVDRPRGAYRWRPKGFFLGTVVLRFLPTSCSPITESYLSESCRKDNILMV
jgi:hypothetical protein